MGRKPETPLRVAGETIEPMVSVPMEKPTKPAAVAAPGPADEPLLPSPVSQGFLVVPPCQTSPLASAPRVSLAMSTAPASYQAFHHRRIKIDDLVLVGHGAPAGGMPARGQQVLGAPGHAMQRTAIDAAADFGISAARLCVRQVFGQASDALQHGIVALEPLEVHFGQLERADLARAQQFRQLRHGQKSDVFEIVGTA